MQDRNKINNFSIKIDEKDLDSFSKELEKLLEDIFESENIKHSISSLKNFIECPDCNGSGCYVGFTNEEKCKLCDGAGKVEKIKTS